jgi:CofH subfamily radical SAM domain protein
MQGGIDVALGLPYYAKMVESIKAWRPGLHLHAFSPQEIHSLAERENKSVAQVLSKLLEAGLDSMPGTAAEILDDRVRKAISPRRLTVAQWEQVVTAAHTLGIPTSATMMFGHLESNANRAAHLMRIRRLQEKTSGFTEFVPMPFMPCNTALQRARLLPDSQPATAENAHIIAVSRLVLDDVLPNIQVSWVKNGLQEAAAALRAGANDLGGTLYEENITRLAGGTHGTHATPLEFRRVARSVGLRARERTTLYDVRIRPRFRRRASA